MAVTCNKVLRQILQALDATGVPYDYELGAKHYLIRHNGVFVGIMPRGKTSDASRETKNLVAQLRRASKGNPHGRRTTT